MLLSDWRWYNAIVTKGHNNWNKQHLTINWWDWHTPYHTCHAQQCMVICQALCSRARALWENQGLDMYVCMHSSHKPGSTTLTYNCPMQSLCFGQTVTIVHQPLSTFIIGRNQPRFSSSSSRSAGGEDARRVFCLFFYSVFIWLASFLGSLGRPSFANRAVESVHRILPWKHLFYFPALFSLVSSNIFKHVHVVHMAILCPSRIVLGIPLIHICYLQTLPHCKPAALGPWHALCLSQ